VGAKGLYHHCIVILIHQKKFLSSFYFDFWKFFLSEGQRPIPWQKYTQFLDDRIDFGEGQADQASKYLGLRIMRSLGELTSSMGKISIDRS
jgi:hypothetical protein